MGGADAGRRPDPQSDEGPVEACGGGIDPARLGPWANHRRICAGRLKEIAAETGLSQAETTRWFVEYMIPLYDAGLRPETEVAVVRRRVKRG